MALHQGFRTTTSTTRRDKGESTDLNMTTIVFFAQKSVYISTRTTLMSTRQSSSVSWSQYL